MLRYNDYDIVFQEIPDETTLAINITNCPNRCKDCHSPQLWEDTGAYLNEQVLLELLEKYGKAITCVCFMGGDANPHEVEKLAIFLHMQTVARVKIGWYSGKTKIPSDIVPGNFDFIKLGPYISVLGNLNSKKTNQKFYQVKNQQWIDRTSCFWK